jgi:hypothetical protein
MALIAKGSGNGGDFETIPTGPQHAVCAFVVDIGTHAGSYQGKPIQRHQCVVCWELSEHMTQGEHAGKPFMVSKFYTVSLNEKANLRKDLEAWRGKAFTEEELAGFDLEKLIGVNCMLNIVEKHRQDGKTFREVSSIMPAIKGLPKLAVVNTVPPEWVLKRREESIEAQEAVNSGVRAPAYQAPAQDDDSLPF